MSLFQLIFTGFWLLKKLQTAKISFYVLKNTFYKHYKTLELAYIPGGGGAR